MPNKEGIRIQDLEYMVNCITCCDIKDVQNFIQLY